MSEGGDPPEADSGKPVARTREQFKRDLDDSSQAHAGNETSRDAFLAVAHTALFVAAVAFASDLDASTVKGFWLAIIGLSFNVLGLIAQTISYPAASHLIHRRYEQVNSKDEPKSKLVDVCNNIALWSFPASVLAICAFVLINLGTAMTEPTDPADGFKEALEKGVTAAPRAPRYEPSPRGRPGRNWSDSSTPSARLRATSAV